MTHLPYSRTPLGGNPMATADTPTSPDVPALRARADLAATFGRLVIAAAGEVDAEDLPILAEAAELVADLADALGRKGGSGADEGRLDRLKWAARVAVMIHRAA